MKELYVRKNWREKPDMKKVVPVKVFPQASSISFDGEVKKKLNLLKEQSVEFRKFSEEKGKSDAGVVERFRLIVNRMIRIVRDEGCYYPDSIRKEVVSVSLSNGGSVFSVLFNNMNVDESLQNIQLNCSAA